MTLILKFGFTNYLTVMHLMRSPDIEVDEAGIVITGWTNGTLNVSASTTQLNFTNVSGYVSSLDLSHFNLNGWWDMRLWMER